MTCKSYTGKANINIYNGDCMEFMKDKPAKSYDLAICDPPYGIDINHNIGRRKNDKPSNHKKVTWDSVIPNKEYFNSLFFISENQIIWGGNYFELPPTKCFMIWNKPQMSDLVSFAMCEYAWSSFNTTAKVFHNTYIDSKIHPTQKPVALYKWLLTNYAKPNDKILDTHGGSMSIAIACWDLGFDLDIIELDKDYYDKAVQRFERHINQKQIF
jgi:site-specific DNA-methyltransferase (adenine-specific)